MNLDDWNKSDEQGERINEEFLNKKFSELSKKIEKEERKETFDTQEISCGVEDEEVQNIIEEIRDQNIEVTPEIDFRANREPVHFLKAIQYFFANIDNLEDCEPKLMFYSDYEEESASKYKIQLKFKEDRFKNRHKYREELNESLKLHGVQDKKRDVFLRVKLRDEDQ